MLKQTRANDHVWALLLAAGDGTRLHDITTTHEGHRVPKQFCSLHDGPSLLQETLHRASNIAPRQNILAVVAASHRHWWESHLWALPKTNVIVQPSNRGTANGILLPLLHILERDPEARVVLLPCDHYVSDETTLNASLCAALGHIDRQDQHVVLLGMEPDEPDPDLGYIVPALDYTEYGGLTTVARFVEKPQLLQARQLIERGALWNAFILVTHALALLRLFEARMPELTMEMNAVVQSVLHESADSLALLDLYQRLPTLDFSRHILRDCEEHLRVLRVPYCGWTDLGTPNRLATTLERLARQASFATDRYTQHLSLAAQHARLQNTRHDSRSSTLR